MENSIAVSKKLKIELPYDPAIPLLGIYLKKKKGTFLVVGLLCLSSG